MKPMEKNALDGVMAFLVRRRSRGASESDTFVVRPAFPVRWGSAAEAWRFVHESEAAALATRLRGQHRHVLASARPLFHVVPAEDPGAVVRPGRRKAAAPSYFCEARSPGGFACSRRRGHVGAHIAAGEGGRIAARWEVGDGEAV